MERKYPIEVSGFITSDRKYFEVYELAEAECWQARLNFKDWYMNIFGEGYEDVVSFEDTVAFLEESQEEVYKFLLAVRREKQFPKKLED